MHRQRSHCHSETIAHPSSRARRKVKHRLHSAVKKPVHVTRTSVHGLWELQNRERRRLRMEMAAMRKRWESGE
jgi:hypothetical protein